MSGGALRWVWLGTMPYRSAWDLQVRCAALRRDGVLRDDIVLMLEHPPVYTMGRNGDPRHLGDGPAALRARGADYVEVDRGGSVTFHGPGQLVAYPILALAQRFPVGGGAFGDVDRYLRALEQALIDTAHAYDIEVTRRPPYTGAWHGSDKLAAIGVKLAHGVTTHGVALNICTDLTWFSHVIPCGIDGAGVTSLERLGGRDLTPVSVAPVFAAQLARVLHAAPVEMAAISLHDAVAQGAAA